MGQVYLHGMTARLLQLLILMLYNFARGESFLGGPTGDHRAFLGRLNMNEQSILGTFYWTLMDGLSTRVSSVLE